MKIAKEEHTPISINESAFAVAMHTPFMAKVARLVNNQFTE